MADTNRLPKTEGFAQEVQLRLESGLDIHNLRGIAFVQEPKQGKVLGTDEQLVHVVTRRVQRV